MSALRSVGLEHLAQPRHKSLNDCRRSSRRMLPPELVDEALRIDRLACMERQEGEKRATPARR
jgi:hypothetical protein